MYGVGAGGQDAGDTTKKIIYTRDLIGYIILYFNSVFFFIIRKEFLFVGSVQIKNII